MMRKAMTLPSGRVAKWLIFAIWIVLLVPASLLAGKLGDVEKNDNSAWPPGNAESVRVVDQGQEVPARRGPAGDRDL